MVPSESCLTAIFYNQLTIGFKNHTEGSIQYQTLTMFEFDDYHIVMDQTDSGLMDGIFETPARNPSLNMYGEHTWGRRLCI